MASLDLIAKGLLWLFTAPSSDLLAKGAKGVTIGLSAAETMKRIDALAEQSRSPSRLKREDDAPMAEGAHGDATGERAFFDETWEPHPRKTDGGTTMKKAKPR